MAIQAAHKSLLERNPAAKPSELIREFTPPREFASATLDNYFPDNNFPSQDSALAAIKDFVATPKKSKDRPGVYLDGGFGVGKTHLLASAWKAFPSKKKLFGSFIAYTALIGALGFASALKELKGFDFIAIDEFELDDPGNTMIMSRLINELALHNVRFMVTSNTAPNALGEGRFAAADFQREILGIGRAFEVLRIDGEDYRHRPFGDSHRVFTDDELGLWISASGFADDFRQLLDKLAEVHPSLYSRLLSDVERLAITDAFELKSQNDGLRFVAFVDRAYELQIPLRSSGRALTDVFPDEFINSGYQKKYLRAISRLGALSDDQV